MKKNLLIVFITLSYFIFGSTLDEKVKKIFVDAFSYYEGKVKVEKSNESYNIILDFKTVDFNSEYYTLLNFIADALNYSNYKITEKNNDVNTITVICDKTFKRIEKISFDYESSISKVKYNVLYKLNNRNTILSEKDFLVYLKDKCIPFNSNFDSFLKSIKINDYDLEIEGLNSGIYDEIVELNIKGMGINALGIATPEGRYLLKIDLDKTNRGIKKGDTYDKLLKVYGKENISVEYEGQDWGSQKIYTLGDKQLRFLVVDGEIYQIMITQNFKYEMNYK